MTTFTMQDLNNMPTTPEEDEAMEVLAKLGAGVSLKQMGEVLPNPQQAPEPQPTLEQILKTIGEQFALLSTVISQTKAQPNTTPPEGDQSLQECVSATLQQAAWFEEMVAEHIDEDIVEEAVKDKVENEVEFYFQHRFNPSDHFDIDDCVSNAVSDQLDDVVRDRLDDVVAEQLEELVAEKLQGMKIVFE